MKKRIRELIILSIIIQLLSLTSCAGPAVLPQTSVPSSALSPSPSPSQNPYHSGVKTDYSNLTPYAPPEEIYTRLSPDDMPHLVPSDDYGPLLPYVGQVMHGDDYHNIPVYGFMTAGGMLVTDAVYSSVTQIDSDLPFYVLRQQAEGFIYKKPDKELPYTIVPPDMFRYALCAADGSWVTPFDYAGEILRNETVIMVRDYKTNDADIYDLTGKLLYNTKHRFGHMGENLFNSVVPILRSNGDLNDIGYYNYKGIESDHYGKGYYPIRLPGEKYAYMGELTGAVTSTDFDKAGEFSDGLAPVSKDGLWGYIDESFSLVIPLQYETAGSFFSGYAVVRLPGGEDAVIDKDGQVKLQAADIELMYDLYTINDSKGQTHYDINLKKLAGGQNAYLSPIGNGWYAEDGKGKAVLYHDGKSYVIEGVDRVISVLDGFACCWNYKNDIDYGASVLTLDGKVLIPMISPGNAYYELVKDPADSSVYFVANNFGEYTYMVKKLDGATLLSGDGRVAYNAQANLFSVQTDQYFAYMDTTGRVIFRISLLNSLPD